MTSGGRVYEGSNLPIMIQQQRSQKASASSIPACSSQRLESFYLSGSSSSFLGSSSMVSFEDINGSGKSNKRPFFHSFEQDDYGDEECDEYFNQSGKKRRLSVDQLKFLETSFEVDNKLEPDRKLQLAKDLGLQPRQVAIWFQNRRARWKTKQMEKDYDVLQESFNQLKGNYDNLYKEKEQLKSQIELLSEEYSQKHRGNKEMPEALLEPSVGGNPAAAAAVSDSEESKVSVVASKHDVYEYATSPKNDGDRNNVDGDGIFDSDSTSTKNTMMFDSDSHYYIEDNDFSHSPSPHLEHVVDSSYMFEPTTDHSDLSSQDEEDSLSRGFLPSTPYRVPKMEPGGDYSIASSSSSRNFGFRVEENAFWSWSF